MRVRVLGPGDAAAFQAIRLEGLRLHPEAFGADAAEEAALDLAAVATRLAPAPPGAVFGAEAAGGLLGIAGLAVQPWVKQRHKALLWGLYVRPAARGQGVGAALLGAAAAHARAAGIEQVQLGVGVGNAPARALYAAAGYREFGVERRALRLGPGRYVDEALMVLALDAPG